jgi:hypothetical protein
MAESQYGSPIYIPGNGATHVLEREALTAKEGGENYNEAWLQRLLFEYPGALPFSDIDQAYSGAIPVCIELNTPAGPLDVLYVTPQGKLIILEAKLWRNPEARRKVVGQILDYAKEVSKWGYEDLQREVAKATGQKGNVLYEVVKAVYDDVDEAKFVDEVSRNLRTGRFLLLIAGDGIREGVGSIAEFLERYGSLEFTFGLIEMAVYRFQGDDLIVQPRILAKSVIYKRSVVVTEDPKIVVIEDVGEMEEDDEVTDKIRYIREFWSEFLNELKLDDPSQAMPNPGKGQNIYFYPVPGAPFWVSAYLSPSNNTIGVYLRFQKGEYANDIYKYLEEDRESIDSELGIPVNWKSDGQKHSVISSLKGIDALNTTRRGEMKEFLSDSVNRFINVFRPRLSEYVENN